MADGQNDSGSRFPWLPILIGILGGLIGAAISVQIHTPEAWSLGETFLSLGAIFFFHYGGIGFVVGAIITGIASALIKKSGVSVSGTLFSTQQRNPHSPPASETDRGSNIVMSNENENSTPSNGMGPVFLCMAVGMVLLIMTFLGGIPIPSGNMGARSAQSLEAHFALLLLVTVIGAVVTYQLQRIINALQASDK